MKNNKGITLIALVITIIVLIILAGISISLLMGEDGIITKAKQGALNYQNAAIEEQAMLNNLYGDFASEIASATGDLSTLTHIDNTNAATSDKILKDYKAYVNGELLTGTMNNYSSNPEKITLTSSQTVETTFNINPGYHDKIIVDASAVYDAGTEAATDDLEHIISGSTLVASGGGQYGSGCTYTVTEDCILLCIQGTWTKGNDCWAQCTGYTTLISGGASGTHGGGAWLVYAKTGDVITLKYGYNMSGQSGVSQIYKLSF